MGKIAPILKDGHLSNTSCSNHCFSGKKIFNLEIIWAGFIHFSRWWLVALMDFLSLNLFNMKLDQDLWITWHHLEWHRILRKSEKFEMLITILKILQKKLCRSVKDVWADSRISDPKPAFFWTQFYRYTIVVNCRAVREIDIDIFLVIGLGHKCLTRVGSVFFSLGLILENFH